MATNPTLLAMPLAENGQKNVIPTTQATAGDGLFSQSTGFPAETSLPLGAGGVAPSREDFNGMANLLGGVAFMAQKGFTFNYDAGQDYYKGCVVIDPNDGNRYLCIADMPAGTIAPSADTTGTYWTIFPFGLLNKRDVITTSGTYTAPVTGWYKITVKGGGGGGAASYYLASPLSYFGGGGGGEGGTAVGYEKLTVGDTVSVVIGAGGAGGQLGTGVRVGTNGGDSTVAVNSNTYTGGGGKGGIDYQSNKGGGGLGGTGTIPGAAGNSAVAGVSSSIHAYDGGSGGGAGGGTSNASTLDGAAGGGGAGGYVAGTTPVVGGNGGDGYVWFEYFEPSLM